eukprot:643351-Rhodomonas_salina.1
MSLPFPTVAPSMCSHPLCVIVYACGSRTWGSQEEGSVRGVAEHRSVPTKGTIELQKKPLFLDKIVTAPRRIA